MKHSSTKMLKKCCPNLSEALLLKYKNVTYHTTSITHFSDLFNPLKQLCVWFEEIPDENQEHEVSARYSKTNQHRAHGY
jgi:hypothetical protein